MALLVQAKYCLLIFRFTCPLFHEVLQSAFAGSLQHHYPNFVRCCQDDLGSRKAVEAAAQEALSEGFSVIIDRTNVDVRVGVVDLMCV